MSLLGQMDGSSLLLKTGKAGRIALHVAAIQGSFELLSTIHDFFPSATYNFRFASLLNEAIDGRSEMKAWVIARYIHGYRYDFRIEKRTCWKLDENFIPELGLRESDYIFHGNEHETASRVVEIITSVWEQGTAKGRYKGLIKSFEQNVDYVQLL